MKILKLITNIFLSVFHHQMFIKLFIVLVKSYLCYMQGVVIKSTGSWYSVRIHNGNCFLCRLKGKFRMKGIKSTNPVSVGDQVLFSRQGKDFIINDILERKNYIVRKSVNLSKQVHIIAANIDQAFLIVTSAFPKTSVGFIDRFLVTAEAYQIPTVLVFNKIDLHDKSHLESHKEMISLYRQCGYECIEVSAIKNKNIKELMLKMKEKVNLLSGHSGVGKSTLVNAINPNLDLLTKSVSKTHNKGMHTTTFAEMFALDFGGFIIDTPGIKGLGLVDIDPQELSNYFPEMLKIKSQCRFHNCKHINEPSCAVKEALNTGEVNRIRYDSYLSILDDDNNSYREAKYH